MKVKKKAKMTRTMQTLAALIAVAIFLLPVARATPLLEREGFTQENFSIESKDTSLKEESLSERDDLKEKSLSQSSLKEESQGNEFSFGNKSNSILEKENIPFRTALSPKGLEGALTAPRSQVYCCAAYLLQAIVGVIMSIFGGCGTFFSGICLCGVAVGGCFPDFCFTLIDSFIVGFADFPWAWGTLLLAVTESLPVIIAVSFSLTIISALIIIGAIIGAIAGLIIGAIVGFVIGLPLFFVLGFLWLPFIGAFFGAILFGLIPAIFAFPPLLIGICIFLIAAFLWVVALIFELLAQLFWIGTGSAIFTLFAAVWLILGFCCGWMVAYPGQALILIINFVYGASLLVLSMFFLLFSACCAYGFLFILGPLNLVIAVVSSVLGFIPSVIGGFLAVICFIILGIITLIIQSLTWIWSYLVVPVVDLGVDLGGIYALEAPASIVRVLIGFLMLVLGLCSTCTGFGLPLGIPIFLFGLIIAFTDFIPAIYTSIWTCIAQFPIIQNILAGWMVLVVVIMILLTPAEIIWAIVEGAAYIVDAFFGLLNFFAWILWISCTSSLCVCALAPWGIAVPSCIASIPFSPCYALGFLMDLASWCFLILQNTLFYLWQMFFQSSMD